MGNVKKQDRVAEQDVLRLNHVGIGIKAIAGLLHCHSATVSDRLKEAGVAPTDTRRSFMESVFLALSEEQQDWLSTYLYSRGISVQDYLVGLIKADHETAPALVAAPPPMPVMLQAAPVAAGAAGGDEDAAVELTEDQEASLHVLTEDNELLPATVTAEGEVVVEEPVQTETLEDVEVEDIVEATAEAKEAQVEIPHVEPEFVEDDGTPNPMCGTCNEAPSLTGTETCAGCLDAANNPRTGTDDGE